ncbi:MAG: hypothetical protein NC826_05515 [Candidatus Omnitrophica bacterium]|nr:hypothetical protein [Candidatus Omnitrophota bacterium]
MKYQKNKKLKKKSIIGICILSIVCTLSSSLLWGEDSLVSYFDIAPLKYEEYIKGKIQHGYYVEEFTKMESGQKALLEKMTEIEKLVSKSYETNMAAIIGLRGIFSSILESTQELYWSMQQNQNRAEKTAANLTEFKYVKYSDGKIVNFKEGLVSSIENERVVDEYGNVRIRHTFNMKYDENRLLTSYEATLMDTLGNKNYIYCYGIKYTPDSVFYGGYDTVANKNEIEKHIIEIDPAGNKVETHWKALEYDGKLLKAESVEIDDSINGKSSFTRTNIQYENGNYRRIKSYHEEGVGTDGLKYTKDRTDIQYNDKDQIVGYRETVYITNVDGSITKVTTEAKFEYLYVPPQFGEDVEERDPDRLLRSIITTTVENPDGSKKTETITTNYFYDNNQTLIGASAHSEFNGNSPQRWEYTDNEGHILIREEKDGEVKYYYWDPVNRQKIYVSADQVTSTLKPEYNYQGYADTQYEVISGILMVKQTTSSTSYYGQHISPNELQHVETSTIIYNNQIVTYTNEKGETFRRVQAIERTEHYETTYPLLDPNNAHKSTIDKIYKYEYDTKGNLSGLTLVSGKGHGWEYGANQGFYGEYNSTITEEWKVILGKPVMTKATELREYVN